MFCVEKYNHKKRIWEIIPDTIKDKKKTAEDMEQILNELVDKDFLKSLPVKKLHRTIRLRNKDLQDLKRN